MRLRLLQLSIASLLALGAASDALAQSKADHGDSPGNTAVLPIIYSDSGNKVGAYLLLEPTEQSRVGARWRFGGKNELDAAFGLDAGDSLALLCSGKSGIGSALSSLANNCQLGAINGDDDSHHASATAALTRPGGRVGDQQAVGGGIQERQHRLELVRVELRVRRVHAVHEIGQLTGQLDMGQVPAQVVDAAEPAMLQELVDIVTLVIDEFQFIPGHIARALGKPDLEIGRAHV